ncbi:phage integrase Arm DNA-binding domain-containing protein [Ectopseudomonas hydrolytica]|uniref:phage integrase Arm DNA-binding domain-containing protein n=1 Tax=Ectopseudomonas hydrolytica TaxID=2493633 RepID=UPI00376F0FBF
MAPRPRNLGSKDLPLNLYRKKDKRNGVIYYSYKDPVTGQFFGLGRDKDKAVEAARAENLLLQPALTLRERIERPAKRAFSKWLTEYRSIIDEREIGDQTKKNLRMRIKRLEAEFGKHDINAISTIMVADYLGGMAKAGKAQMSRAMRSLLRDVFMEAMAAGWTAANPVEVTKAARVKVKRERLTLEMWRAIHARARMPWLKRAMELALITGQRRDDIASMLFKDEQDGHLHVIQRKTKHRLRLSTSIGLQCLGMTLADVIRLCRDNIVSKHLIHHPRTISRAKAGSPIMLDTISKAFAEARDAAVEAGDIVVTASPPTFHEMRSLAARLHAAEGRNAQALLGHKSARMTELYRDSRGAEWIDVA